MTRTMLVTTIKDEGPTILEWVAYHRVVGFDTIQVYQNDSTDDTQKTLRTLARTGAIEYYRNPSRKNKWQNKAYRRASFSESFAESDWCMSLDGDEFLNVKIGESGVKDLIGACPDADAIFVNWRNFGSSNHLDLSDEMVMSRYTKAEPENDIQIKRPCGFKSIFKTSAYARPGIHRPKADKIENPVIRNGSGLHESEFDLKIWRSFDPECRKLAQINHYPIRDLSSFLMKHARGSSSHVDREVQLAYWKKYNRNEEVDTSISHLRDKTWAEMERLNELSDGRLFKLRTRSFEIWKEKVAQFREDEALLSLQQTILDELFSKNFRT